MIPIPKTFSCCKLAQLHPQSTRSGPSKTIVAKHLLELIKFDPHSSRVHLSNPTLRIGQRYKRIRQKLALVLLTLRSATVKALPASLQQSTPSASPITAATMSVPARATLAKRAHLLRGKTAIITGATTGIGRAICIDYLRHGAHVVVNHLDLPADRHHFDSLVSIAKEIKSGDPEAGTLDHLPGDVRDPATGAALAKMAIDKWGHLDICVSNAGICTFADFLELSQDLFEKTVRTNLDGAFFIVQAAARQMAKQDPPGGSIIGISSISALVGGAGQTHYTPTKAGILSLMQSTACALGKYGIRCNALLPGTIRTQLNDKDLSGEKGKYMEGRVPLGRIGEIEDMAGPAVFLGCEELSGYVTGAQLLVDGGLFVNLQ
ncbi:hypothetical protein MKZ38_010247 [Zalerion maritima]|uniref:Uncharacterized protein n=1 Tax=Zalerion maritima TaxID=339359 RepID=A0AAD5RTP0_9PEZI|nr:hypothetical protein MKZ38_010247 [Zalerion maritima]